MVTQLEKKSMLKRIWRPFPSSISSWQKRFFSIWKRKFGWF